MNEITPEAVRLRVRIAEEIRLLEARILAQAGALVERDATIHELTARLAKRDAYVHQLHLQQIERGKEVESMTADLEEIAWMLEAAEAQVAGLRAPVPGDLPGADFSYHLYTSPFRIFRSAGFTLRGWLSARDGRAVDGVRVRVDQAEFLGRHALEDPGAAQEIGDAASRPGFEINFATPPGRHRFRLEASLDGLGWASVLNAPMWCRRE